MCRCEKYISLHIARQESKIALSLSVGTLTVSKAISDLRMAIEESGAEVTYDKLPVIMSDNSQIRSLFQNLIGNAIKFHSNETPNVHISAEKKRQEWVFLSDNDIGIDLEHANRIFVSFNAFIRGKNIAALAAEEQ